MRARSSLSVGQREELVALFAQGCGYRTAAHHAGVGVYPVHALFHRFLLHGKLCLVEMPSKQQYSFEIKKEVVQRHLTGESKMNLAREFGLWSDIGRESGTRR